MSNESGRQNIERVHQGQVKWFDNKLGYGFITINSSGEHSGKDVFVHQTNITPLSSEYRTLSKGEYVSLNLSNDEQCQALDVSGINGGPLRCDAPRPPRRHGHRGQRGGHRGGHRGGSRDGEDTSGENSSRHDRQ